MNRLVRRGLRGRIHYHRIELYRHGRFPNTENEDKFDVFIRGFFGCKQAGNWNNEKMQSTQSTPPNQ